METLLTNPAEMLTVALCVAWQAVSFPANRTHACNVPSPRWNVTRSLSWQGGGVYVSSGGEATLTNSNVYQNEAKYVRSLFEPSSSAPLVC